MSPKSAKQFTAIRKKSSENIMEAAIELFAKKGYHGTSISDIAVKAGVSKGLMYNYFKSKDKLLDGILKNALREFDTPFRAMHAVLDPYSRLEMILDGIFGMVKSKEEKRHWQFMLSLMTQREVMLKIQSSFSKFLRSYIQLFEHLFKEMGLADPKIESYRLAALIDGVMLHHLNVFPKNYPMEDIKRNILKTYEKHRQKKQSA